MKITNTRLARRYAVAFINLYGDKLQEADFFALREAFTFLLNNTDIFFFLTLPSITKQQQQDVVAMFVKKFNLIPEIAQACMLLIEHGRIALLQDLFRSLLWEYQAIYKKLFFTVYSSHPLSQDARDGIKTFLVQQSGKDVMLDYAVDASLIAGIKIIGDAFYWEYSIARQLNNIKQAITV